MVEYNVIQQNITYEHMIKITYLAHELLQDKLSMTSAIKKTE